MSEKKRDAGYRAALTGAKMCIRDRISEATVMQYIEEQKSHE